MYIFLFSILPKRISKCVFIRRYITTFLFLVTNSLKQSPSQKTKIQKQRRIKLSQDVKNMLKQGFCY